GYLSDGAIDDVPDERLLDTRTSAKPANWSQTVVTGRPNRSAIISLVATQTSLATYLQVLPCGAEPGATSNLNADRSGQTIAGLAVVRFDANGEVCVFVQHATHVVVDLQAYLSDAAFEDITDLRILDTRTR
ncbi:MAG TPA: hypothetical protein PLV68_09885, partial [Ilumatobacteraceae bacterium]|nr:hypothetical protein [Ilumatobacteraceae bacterium]